MATDVHTRTPAARQRYGLVLLAFFASLPALAGLGFAAAMLYGYPS